MKSELIVYNHEDIHPMKVDVLDALGISKEVSIPAEVEELYNQSFELFKQLIAPRGIFKISSKQDFDYIYQGEKQNDALTPLPHIIHKAHHLALYAFTLGTEISQHIDQLMKEKDYPLGYLLDRIASESADKASQVAEKLFTEKMNQQDATNYEQKTLLYSPGYCGWHVSGQKKLFEYLEPQEIGVTHNESFLMTPVKSVSGVLVCGDRDIHLFKNNYDFCRDCNTHSCRERSK